MATSFDFGGLLGNTFGGNLSALDDLLTPEQRAAIQQQAGLSAAAALLQAAGPSTTRTSLGQALGSAFTAGQAGMQKGTESALTQMLTRQKLDEAKRARDLQARIAGVLTGEGAPVSAQGEVTPAGALAAPGMAVGPTVERAALIGQQAQQPAMSANEVKAAQYRRVADAYAAFGKSEDATRFIDMAEKLAPTRQEVVGQPFEVTAADGKPVMVQQFKDGTIRTMAGFGPKREVVLQTVDGQVRAINKSQLAGGEVYGTGMTPVERERLRIEQANLGIAQQRLGLSQAEFNRGQYDRVESAQGIVYVPKVPGLPIIPITDTAGQPLMGAGGKPSEGESNAAGYAQRMERVDAIISKLPATAAPGVTSAMAGSVPLVGGVLQRGVQNAQEQQYKQAADDWIRAKLRKESGAAIGAEEMAQEYRTYFPQVGDTAEVIAQKAYARQVATGAMRQSAGKAYKPFVESEEERKSRGQDSAGAQFQEGSKSKDRQGRAIVYRNGKWVYE
jgi:hypothetical protein